MASTTPLETTETADTDTDIDPTTETPAATVPSPPSFRFENNASTQSLLGRGLGSDYGSQYGSQYGSRFSLTAGSAGIYISSLAMTIIISVLAIIGIILVTVIITLAVMLSSCEKRHNTAVNLQKPRDADYCASFQLNAEVNNLQGWTVPLLCESHVSGYIHGGQYHRDFEAAVDSARKYLKTLVVDYKGRDVIVLDVDETALSNIPYYRNHHYGAGELQDYIWYDWVEEARAPALVPLLDLYRELQADNWSIIFITGRPEYERNVTAHNLIAAGYKGWTSLILRSVEEVGLTAHAYKSKRRLQLEKEGYQIRSVLGDQWSDIIGPAVGDRTFKLPNPMYHVF